MYLSKCVKKSIPSKTIVNSNQKSFKMSTTPNIKIKNKINNKIIMTKFRVHYFEVLKKVLEYLKYQKVFQGLVFQVPGT